MKIVPRESINLLLIVLGVLSAGMGIKGFLLAGGFIDGGITGVSMLLRGATGIPLSIWLPVLNLPFALIGYRHLGGAFAVRSVLAILGLSLALWWVPYPEVTSDRVLIALFGGFFLGAGIGLAVRGEAVLDGTEIVALLLSKRSHLFNVGDVILGFNVLLFSVAIATLGIESALYSILTYLTAARTLDFVIYGLEEYTSITITSSFSPEIRQALVDSLSRGVTVFRGFGGKSGLEQEILYCVVTRLEIGKVKALVRAIDRDAFIVVQSLADVDGGVVRRAPAATLHG